MAAAAVAVSAALGAASSVAAAGTPPVPRTQEIAYLLESHKVVAGIHTSRRRRVGAVPGLTPITRVRTVLPVVGHSQTPDGVRWLRVELPGRPNGHSGWIARRATVSASTRWHVVVSTGRRRVQVYRLGRRVRTFRAIVGKPSTPTPRGRFFVEEGVRMGSGSVGGPFALALSARSNVLQEFNGGPGQIALHGVANLGGTFGTASSHGCVRLPNRNIRWLAMHVGQGSPVTITR
jgi:lipoprotein-anchoring transpeptidase ErfK/SrfK